MKAKENVKCLHQTSIKGKFCNKCGKKLNILERFFTPKKQLNNNDTMYICNVCNASNKFSYNFCTNCGNDLKTGIFIFKTTPPVPHTPPAPPKRIYKQETAKDYLSKIGLLHLAEQTFNINILIDNGERINIQLKGYQSSSDALEKLRELGFLQSDKMWKFTNWPCHPFHHRGIACVCELEMNQVYCVESHNFPDIREMYGCPNPAAINYTNIISKVHIEVVDYGKN